MWLSILLLTGLFSVKNIIFLYTFDYNYLIFVFDLIGLAIGSPLLQWSYIFEWLLLGWVGLPDELHFLENDYFDFSPWAPTISWSIIFVIFNIFYLIKYKCNRIKWTECNLKLMMINYLPITLWNLHRIIDISSDNFWALFTNLMFFNIMAFGLLSILFNFIYGDNLVYYRENFYFLIKDFKPEYKWFIIYTYIIQLCTATFIFYHHFFIQSDYYLIIGIVLFYLFTIIFIRPYKNPLNNIMLIVSLLLALGILLFGQVENYYDNITIFILKCIILVIMFISCFVLCILNCKSKKITVEKVESVELLVNDNQNLLLDTE